MRLCGHARARPAVLPAVVPGTDACTVETLHEVADFSLESFYQGRSRQCEVAAPALVPVGPQLHYKDGYALGTKEPMGAGTGSSLLETFPSCSKPSFA